MIAEDPGLPATTTWPGSKPTLLLTHATGFCKEVWRPVVEEARRAGIDNEIVALDFAGHGATPVRVDPGDWSGFTTDVAQVVDRLGSPVVGVGHSMGATALILAELARPGSFAGLMLIEPVVFPDGGRDELLERLERATLRRKGEFSDRAAASSNFRGKPAFAGWHHAALEGYLDGGLVTVDGGVALSCPPQVEARVYPGAARHRAWYRLHELNLPVVVMASGASAEFPPGFLGEIVQRITGARALEVPGTSHFLPMERPDAVAAEMVTLISEDQTSREVGVDNPLSVVRPAAYPG